MNMYIEVCLTKNHSEVQQLKNLYLKLTFMLYIEILAQIFFDFVDDFSKTID